MPDTADDRIHSSNDRGAERTVDLSPPPDIAVTFGVNGALSVAPGNGIFRFGALQSGLLADHRADSTFVTHRWGNVPTQLWQFESIGNGNFRIISSHGIIES